MRRQSVGATARLALLGMTCLFGWLCWAEQPEQVEQANQVEHPKEVEWGDTRPAFRTLAIKIERADERKAHRHSSVVKVDPAAGQMILYLGSCAMGSDEIEKLKADKNPQWKGRGYNMYAISPGGMPTRIGLDKDWSSVSYLSKQAVIVDGAKCHFVVPHHGWTERTASGTLSLTSEPGVAGAYRMRGVYWCRGCLFVIDSVLKPDQWFFLHEPPPAERGSGPVIRPAEKSGD